MLIIAGGEGIASFLEEESDPSVFVMSPSALESLSPEDAAAAIEGMVSYNKENKKEEETVSCTKKEVLCTQRTIHSFPANTGQDSCRIDTGYVPSFALTY